MLIVTQEFGPLSQIQIDMLRFLGVKVVTYHHYEGFRYILSPAADLAAAAAEMSQREAINPTPKFERTRSKKAPRIW